MKKLVLLFLLLPLSLMAQENLVPDPGFEGLKRSRCKWVQSPRMFAQSFEEWTAATATHPDIFSTMVEADCWAHPNNHSKGKQLPRSGTTMTGVRTFGLGGKKGNDTPWREYVQTRLTAPLEAGKTYYAEVWVARAQRAVRATNNLGIYFSDTLVDTRNRLPLCVTPQINHEEIIEGLEWYKVSGAFTAKSAAQYVVVGNFYMDSQTLEKDVEGEDGDGYYYLEDLMVRKALAEERPGPAVKVCDCAPPEKINGTASTVEIDLEEVEPELGAIVELRNIHFATGKADLLPASMEELKKLDNLLYNFPNLKIEISGHTDNVGSDAINNQLSLDRAKAVADYLYGKKVKRSRITYQGYGSGQPVATNDTDEGRALNRRVEFKVIER